MQLRDGIAADLPSLIECFTESIHGLAGTDYDEAQRAAWAPRPPDRDAWRHRLDGRVVLVAEDEAAGSGLLGFLAYAEDGYIDMLFVAPSAARRGVASRLFLRAQERLRAAGCARLYTEASALAEPFFARQGFVVTEREVVECRGVPLQRARMAKQFDGSAS